MTGTAIDRAVCRAVPRCAAVVAVAGLMFAAGCQVTPAPSAATNSGVPTRPTFAAAPRHKPAAPVADGWIAQLHDPRLPALVAQAMDHNPDLQRAAGVVAEAKARIALARSDLLPQVAFFGDASRSRQVLFPATINQIDLGVEASWEVDLWGRVRSGVAAAEADEQIAQADLRFARDSIAASVAQGWFIAIAARLQRRIDTDLLKVEQWTLEITRAKVQLAQGSQLDLDLATANVAAARDAVERDKLAYTEAVRALELLMGSYPSAELATRDRLPDIGPTPATGVPSELLERRPDVIAADRAVAAAFYRVQSSKAAQLPRLVLTGSIGEAFDPTSTIWSLGGSLLMPLFDSGALKAGVEITKAQQKQAVAQYVSTAIGAFREVESALASGANLRRRQAQLNAAVASLHRASDSAKARYNAGQMSLLDLDQVQTQYFRTQTQALQVQLDRLRQRVNLYLALGGSFEEPPAAHARVSGKGEADERK